MELPAPIPPPIPFPENFTIPTPVLMQPEGREFQWEPVPLYIEDVPNPIPAPNPKPKVDDGTQEQTEEQRSQLEEKNPKDAKDKPTSGKPEPPPMDLVPEIAEIQTVELPIIGVEVPLPRTEILVTATTTAGVSSVVAVGGTLFATTMFRQLQPILKPIFKFILKKLAALQKKPPPRTFGRERLVQRRLRAVASHPGK